MAGKLIVLDAGHGGYDNGATGVNGTFEKNMTLKTILLLQQKLMAGGANVVMTRDHDEFITLARRVAISNSNHANAFISIHYDSSSNHDVSGSTVYYNHPFQKNLADSIYNQLKLSSPIYTRTVKIGDFHVIRENKQPAILLEMGYLSNAKEETFMASSRFQDEMVTSIYKGLSSYFR